jgi:hypothetical protein
MAPNPAFRVSTSADLLGQFRRLLALRIAFAVPVSAPAQTAREPDPAPPVRLELSATLAGAYPEVAVVDCCGLRTPPSVPSTGTTFTLLSVGMAGRIYWARRFSAAVDVGWNRPARHELTFARPAVAPPALPPFLPSAVVGRTTQRSGWTLSISQGADLVTRGRWRPWLGGEFVFERVAEHYEQTSVVFADSIHTSVYETDRRETLGAGAVTAHQTRREAENLRRGRRHASRVFTKQSLSRAATRWRLGIGVRLGPVL